MNGPFHDGERAVQERLGVRERIEEIGQRVIRDFMPDQHREFFATLRHFFLGGLDRRSRPWASLLAGPPGFLRSPDPHRLHVASWPLPGDPLSEGLRERAPIGGLGIEFASRRRNRVNGKVALDADGAGFTIRVDQSFGNCPQYIQARELRLPSARTGPSTGAVRGDLLDAAARAIIRRADTFFIASHYGGDASRRAHGLDVSHRGGLAGFVRVLDDRTLEFPDYRGNFLFNTLGNLTANPLCGLLFLDFSDGDTLQLTGRAEILWDFQRDDPALRGAERVIRFELHESVHLAGAIPFAWQFRDYAPQLRALQEEES